LAQSQGRDLREIRTISPISLSLPSASIHLNFSHPAMVKFFSQTHKYDDAWSTVTLAYFLRYPNPYASHVIAVDVISRTIMDDGTLKTTRLIKKTGAVPPWFPRQFVSRAETWVVEESEVDPEGRVMSCRTRNLDHVKVMQVQEDVVLREADDNKTIQRTTASIVSNFGWGLTKKIEMYGITKFKANLERSRQGVATVLSALRESRQRLGFQTFALGMTGDSSSADSSVWAPSASSLATPTQTSSGSSPAMEEPVKSPERGWAFLSPQILSGRATVSEQPASEAETPSSLDSVD